MPSKDHLFSARKKLAILKIVKRLGGRQNVRNLEWWQILGGGGRERGWKISLPPPSPEEGDFSPEHAIIYKKNLKHKNSKNFITFPTE